MNKEEIIKNLKFYRWSTIEASIHTERPIEYDIDKFFIEIRQDLPKTTEPYAYVINNAFNGKTAADFLCPSMIFIDIDFHFENEVDKIEEVKIFCEDTNSKSLQDFIDKMSKDKYCISAGLSKSGYGIRMFFNVITSFYEDSIKYDLDYSVDMNKQIHEHNWNYVMRYLSLYYNLDLDAKYSSDKTSSRLHQVTFRYRKTGSFYNVNWEPMINNECYIKEKNKYTITDDIEKYEVPFLDEIYLDNEETFRDIFSHYNSFSSMNYMLRKQPLEVRVWFYNKLKEHYQGHYKYLSSFEDFDKDMTKSGGEDLPLKAFLFKRGIVYMEPFTFQDQQILDNVVEEIYDYKLHSKKENKEYNRVLAKAPIDTIIDKLGTTFSKEKKYQKKEYLFYPVLKEGQIGIMFGITGDGKTVLMLELANMIAKGSSDWDIFRVDTKPQKVLYVDFEIGGESFQSRYPNRVLDDNLIIYNVDVYAYNSAIGFDKKQGDRIDRAIDFIEGLSKTYDSKVIFIDNLSNISDSLEQASEADRFISDLYGRMKALDLTIMFIGHTPKINNGSAISLNQLKGSSSLTKTFESIIGFRRGKEENISYIKQLKGRGLDMLFTNNVAKFEFNKDDTNGWIMDYIGTEEEDELLPEYDKLGKNKSRNKLKYDNLTICKVLYECNIEKTSQRIVCEKYDMPKSSISNFKLYLKNDVNGISKDFDKYCEEQKQKKDYQEKNYKNENTTIDILFDA